MTLIYAYQNRGLTEDITIVDADGATVVPGVNDKVRVIIGREGRLGVDLADAQLVVVNDAPTANGSTFSKNTPSSGVNRLRLDASDLALIPFGSWTLFVDMLDNADSSEWKNVSRQVFVVEQT